MATMLGLPSRWNHDPGARAVATGWLEHLRLRTTPAQASGALAGTPALESACSAILGHFRQLRAGALRALPGGVIAALAAGVDPATSLAAIPLMLCKLGVVRQPWPALVPAWPGDPAGDENRWTRSLIDNLCTSAEAEFASLETLEGAWRRWHQSLPALRGNARLPQLLHLLAHSPGVSAVLAARYLSRLGRKCTVPGASFLLRALVERHIVVEVSGRRSWRFYVPSDLARLKGLNIDPARAGLKGRAGPAELFADSLPPVTLEDIEVTPLRFPPPAVSEIDWGSLFAEIDAANQRVRVHLDRHAGGQDR
jgi:hypothetical protein